MALTREDVRDAVNRAGDQYMRALRSHHEDAYPESRPTPGDICRAEADRLNESGLGSSADFELLETRVERVGTSGWRRQESRWDGQPIPAPRESTL